MGAVYRSERTAIRLIEGKAPLPEWERVAWEEAAIDLPKLLPARLHHFNDLDLNDQGAVSRNLLYELGTKSNGRRDP